MNYCHERGNVRYKVENEGGAGGGGVILITLFCRAHPLVVITTPVIRNKGNHTVPLKAFFPSSIPK